MEKINLSCNLITYYLIIYLCTLLNQATASTGSSLYTNTGNLLTTLPTHDPVSSWLIGGENSNLSVDYSNSQVSSSVLPTSGANIISTTTTTTNDAVTSAVLPVLSLTHDSANNAGIVTWQDAFNSKTKSHKKNKTEDIKCATAECFDAAFSRLNSSGGALTASGFKGDPIELAGLHEGDILVPPSVGQPQPLQLDGVNTLPPNLWHILNEVSHYNEPRSHLWDNGVVPYHFSKDFDFLPLERTLITRTMRNIEKHSCVRFVERTTERDFINIIYDSYKCYSSVGRAGGAQPLSLGMFCSLFWNRGNIYHELLHGLGFYHEHTRPDRDEHVEVQWSNIKEGMEVNFKIDERWPKVMLDMPYDIDSVMHYSSQAFSKLYFILPTLKSKRKGLFFMRATEPSKLDYTKLNTLYKCPKISRRKARLLGWTSQGRSIGSSPYNFGIFNALRRSLNIPSRLLSYFTSSSDTSSRKQSNSYEHNFIPIPHVLEEPYRNPDQIYVQEPSVTILPPPTPLPSSYSFWSAAPPPSFSFQPRTLNAEVVSNTPLVDWSVSRLNGYPQLLHVTAPQKNTFSNSVNINDSDWIPSSRSSRKSFTNSHSPKGPGNVGPSVPNPFLGIWSNTDVKSIEPYPRR